MLTRKGREEIEVREAGTFRSVRPPDPLTA
jgi:hypothetical protein